jgi:hypothetical protein
MILRHTSLLNSATVASTLNIWKSVMLYYRWWETGQGNEVEPYALLLVIRKFLDRLQV